MPRSGKRFDRRDLKVPFMRPEQYDDALELVVGQDDLKVKLKSAFSQYTLFLQDPDVGKPTILVYGESGSGKTFAIERLARATGLPLTIASAGSLSPPSYKGTTMQDLLIRHWTQHRTDMGILYLDEIDKWCKMAMARGQRQAVGAEDVGNGVRSQHELLRYVEMEAVNFVDIARDIEELSDVTFQTQNLLWVLSGAFVGMPSVIRRHVNHYMSDEEVWSHAMPEDFIAYGMVDELAKRIQTFAWTKPLDGMQVARILETQELPKWLKRFAALGCELTVMPGALGIIAHRAFQEKIGARGAVSLMRRSMDDVFYHVSKEGYKSFIVDVDMIETGTVPHLAPHLEVVV